MHIEILYNVTVGDKPKGNTFPLPMGGGVGCIHDGTEKSHTNIWNGYPTLVHVNSKTAQEPDM
jgi:hypothetical protein